MSLQRIYEALINLGLQENDARVYIYLGTHGLRKSHSICNELKIKRQQLHPILKKLQNMHLINASGHHPSIFSAVPFETALDELINLKLKQSKKILEHKNQLIKYWESIEWDNNK